MISKAPPLFNRTDFSPGRRAPLALGRPVRRVLLIQVGRRTSNFFLVTPPLGLMYISGYIKSRRSFEVKIHDMKLLNSNPEQTARMAADFKPDIIGLSVISPNSNHLGPAAKALKEALPSVPLVAGGAHVSAVGAAVFTEAEVDFAVSGEGEESFYDLITTIENLPAADYTPASLGDCHDRLLEVGGLHFFDEASLYTRPLAPKIADLDALPFPDWESVDITAYSKHFTMTPVGKRRYMALFTSRGCPYRCNYCHDHFGKSFRWRSVNSVVDEIEALVNKHNVRQFEIIDDIFNFNRQRTIDICNEINRRGLKIGLTFPNGLRADLLNEEVIDALKAAGTYFISFAIETASERLQKQIKKHMKLDRLAKSVDYAASKGIFCNGFFMLGFPGESREEINHTIDLACRLKLHTASFFIVTPYGGTTLYESLEDQPDKRSLSFSDYDSIFGNANCSDLDDAELYSLQRRAHRRFYLQPLRAVRILKDLPGKRNLLTFIWIFIKRATRKTP